jgi:hypothetical protein
VGARVVVQREQGAALEGRVIGVVEQEAGAKSPPGMRLTFGDALPAPGPSPVPPAPAPAPTPSPDAVPAAAAPRPEPGAPEPADSNQRTEIMMVPQIDPSLLAEDTVPSAVSDDVSGPIEKGDPDASQPGDSPDKGRRGRRRRKPNGR